VGINDTASGDSCSDLGSRILRYFIRNPHAADSAEGVAYFWLADVGPRSPLEVREALDILVDQGLVDRRSNRDGTIIYCASQALRDQTSLHRQPDD
jgi:Fe2+ or Zn2+ uptake regulation protein